ncbi:vasodilator-stimulated phosphoprotein-like [Phoca vitulina]|uniref:vasodilator-stimulated phosphoprotein-like n=1 Tax=Phoca vitulina TaxID=9720 RepID=UPI001395DB6F|nr:vasodilator-stimulated phosphoprotein-like [Phoca vitulina]
MPTRPLTPAPREGRARVTRSLDRQPQKPRALGVPVSTREAGAGARGQTSTCLRIWGRSSASPSQGLAAGRAQSRSDRGRRARPRSLRASVRVSPEPPALPQGCRVQGRPRGRGAPLSVQTTCQGVSLSEVRQHHGSQKMAPAVATAAQAGSRAEPASGACPPPAPGLWSSRPASPLQGGGRPHTPSPPSSGCSTTRGPEGSSASGPGPSAVVQVTLIRMRGRSAEALYQRQAHTTAAWTTLRREPVQ